jgi:hypothetical protein
MGAGRAPSPGAGSGPSPTVTRDAWRLGPSLSRGGTGLTLETEDSNTEPNTPPFVPRSLRDSPWYLSH